MTKRYKTVIFILMLLTLFILNIDRFSELFLLWMPGVESLRETLGEQLHPKGFENYSPLFWVVLFLFLIFGCVSLVIYRQYLTRAIIFTLILYGLLEVFIIDPFWLIVALVFSIIVGILAHVTVEDERFRDFFQPAKDFLMKGRWGFVPLPILIAFLVFLRLSATGLPAELRTIHPAAPDEVVFRGKTIKIQGFENPFRRLEEEDSDAFEEHVKEGAKVYFENCLFCHGPKLKGDGHFAKGFNPRPSDFTDSGTIAQLEEPFLFWRISKGAPGLPDQSTPWNSSMPVWEDFLTEDEIWDVILFLYERAGVEPRTWEVKKKAQEKTEVVDAPPSRVVDEALSRPEKELYDEKCGYCHGFEGKGDGPAADYLDPRPRDFTRGVYKIRSTESGEFPTDEDLFYVITEGMPGSSMPGWKNLTEEERWTLVKYIKDFSERFKRLVESKGSPKEIALGKEIPPMGKESIEEGRKIYEEIECAKCHGQEGRGDGPSAPTLKDDWDFPIRATNLTRSWNFRGGNSREEIYKRFIGGLAGTPMPAIAESFQMPEEMEDIIIKIEDEEELTPDEQNIFDETMAEIEKKSWHLANYVKSLSLQEPKVNSVIKSKFIDEDVPNEPDDERWNKIEANEFPLVGQIIIEPRMFTPSIDAVAIKSFYNDKEIAFLLIWDDGTENVPSSVVDEALSLPESGEEDDSDESESDETSDESVVGEALSLPKIFEDAIAIQFPVEIPTGPEKPYFIMGDSRRPVNLWHWKSTEAMTVVAQDSILVTEMDASGIDKQAIQKQESQQTEGKKVYSHGQYRLVMKRSLTTEDGNDIQFEPEKFIPIAFSAWDGSNGETGAKNSISAWYYLILDQPAPKTQYSYPPLAAFIVIGLQLLLSLQIRRKEGQTVPRRSRFP